MADRSRQIALLVAGAFFMENLDGTVIATAIPQMAVTFGVRPADLGVGVSAYLLTLAVLLPLSGWVADRYGPRPVFASALGLFTVASLLCAASTGLHGFVLARILQGAGGAMMVPVGRLVVLRTTAKADLVRAIATLTWPALAAPIIAPPLGGFITTYATWRWVFLINLPIGALGIILALRLMPSGVSEPRRPLDWLGFLLTALSCLGLMSAVDAMGAAQIDWLRAGSLLAVGIVTGALAIVVARRHPTPLLDFSTVRIPSFAVGLVGGSLFRIAISAVPFLLPLMFQVGFGYDAFHSGLLVLTLFAGNLAIKPATTPLLRRLGFRTVLVGNGLLAAATVAACGTITPTMPLPVLLVLLFCSGAARSVQFTAINTIVFADVPADRLSGANTLFNMVQQVSLGLGIAVGVLALRIAEVWSGSNAGILTAREFHWAFLMISVIAALATIDAIGLHPETGLHVSRGRP